MSTRRELCPMHSGEPMHKAVRSNRVNLGLPPQSCTCAESIDDLLSTTLIAHQFHVFDTSEPRDVGCTCGWRQPEDNRNAERHASHVVAALAAIGGAS